MAHPHARLRLPRAFSCVAARPAIASLLMCMCLCLMRVLLARNRRGGHPLWRCPTPRRRFCCCFKSRCNRHPRMYCYRYAAYRGANMPATCMLRAAAARKLKFAPQSCRPTPQSDLSPATTAASTSLSTFWHHHHTSLPFSHARSPRQKTHTKWQVVLLVNQRPYLLSPASCPPVARQGNQGCAGTAYW